MGEQIQKPVRHWRFSTQNYDTLLPPGPLAEHVEPQLALTGMRHCMTLRKTEGHFHSAWHHVEYAMNQGIQELDDSLRQKYIGDASYLIASLTNSSGEKKRHVSQNLYAQAITLNIFLPAFTKRALNQEVNKGDCQRIYNSFGYLFDELLTENKAFDISYRPTRFSEMLGFGLSARSLQPELLLYPASPREEASSLQESNHDGYFIRQATKLPVQAKLDKTNKIYRSPIHVICMEPLSRHALERSGCIDRNEELAFGDATLLLAELAVRETVYNDADANEIRALDFATRSIVGRYRFSYPNLQVSA